MDKKTLTGMAKYSEKNKLKVVWITGFSNEKVRSKLSLVKNPLIEKIRKWFGKRPRQFYQDFASWIPTLIDEFKAFPHVELHVISAHKGMTHPWQFFQIDGVHYHFFKKDIPILQYEIQNKHWFGLNPNILYSRLCHKYFLKAIKPDIVNLFGAEGVIKSAPTLDINNIPVYLSVQTVYSNPQRMEYYKVNKLRWDTEMKVHKKVMYFGSVIKMYNNLILSRNPDAKFFNFIFPTVRPERLQYVQKKYDFVFFANSLSKVKGVSDAIEALALVKIHKHNVSLNLVGNAGYEILHALKEKIKTLGIDDNVEFTAFFEKQSDMHRHIQQAHFAVLPAKLDAVASTIREAMYLGLPVVAYNTSGTPLLNREKQTILLSDIGDIQGLANNMMELLDNPKLVSEIKSNAMDLAMKMFNNEGIANSLLNHYFAVIDHYHYGKPIPKQLLFDPDVLPSN